MFRTGTMMQFRVPRIQVLIGIAAGYLGIFVHAAVPPAYGEIVVYRVVHPESSGIHPGDLLESLDGWELHTPIGLSFAIDRARAYRPARSVIAVMHRGTRRLRIRVSPDVLDLRVRPVFPEDLETPELETVLHWIDEEPPLHITDLRERTRWMERLRRIYALARRVRDRGAFWAAFWLYRTAFRWAMALNRWDVPCEVLLRLWESLQDRDAPAEQADLAMQLGECARMRRAFADARRWFQRMRRIAEQADNPIWVAQSLHMLGNVELDRERFQTGETYFLQALRLWQRYAPDDLRTAKTLNNLGAIADIHGDRDRAERYYLAALKIKERQIPNSLSVAITLNNLGILAAVWGNWSDAMAYFSRSLRIRERLEPESPRVAHTLNNLGNVVSSLGHFDQAEAYYRRALQIYSRSDPESLDVAMVLTNLGILMYYRGRLAESELLHRQALVIKQRHRMDALDMVYDYRSMGYIALDRNQPDRAERYLRQAYRLLERHRSLGPDAVSLMLDLARTALQTLRRDDAARWARRGCTRAHQIVPATWYEAECYWIRSRLAHARGDPERALREILTALDILDRQRTHIRNPWKRMMFFVKYRKMYTDGIERALELHRPVLAMRIAERVRARTLFEMMAHRDILQLQKIVPALSARQRQIERRRWTIYQQLVRLDPTTHRDEIERLRTALFRVIDAQHALETEIIRRFPAYADVEVPRSFNLAEIDAALDPGTTVLEYWVTDTGTWVWVLQKPATDRENGPVVHVTQLSLTSREIARRVRILRQRIEKCNPHFLRTARQLYDALIRPVASWLRQAERLLILPDGPLYALPFAALVQSVSDAQPRYLIDVVPLHVIPSLRLYTRLVRSRTDRPSRSIRVVAYGVSSFAQTRTPEFSGARLRQLPPLPGVRQEIQTVARLFNPHVTARIDQAATESRLAKEAARADVLHLAAHGLIDTAFPLESGLVLYPGAGTGPESDGFLQAWEIMQRFRLDASLVVLSACRTGIGRSVQGEGVVGLTWAFLFAGARSVLVSLWPVSDPATAYWMRTFYRALRQGGSKDVAIQIAMQRTRRHPEWSHPYYWSGFALIGDWQ